MLTFQSDVRTRNLAGVIVENTDYETVYWAMKRSSEYSGHDKAPANSNPLPTNDEINEDVKKIDDFKNTINKRRKECEKKRKSIQNPPKAQTA